MAIQKINLGKENKGKDISSETVVVKMKFSPALVASTDIGMKYDAVLFQCQEEVFASRRMVQGKRQAKRETWKRYNDQRTGEEKKQKIRINTVYNIMNTLLAIYYTDDLTVEFQPRKFIDNTQISNLNRLAQFDHGEMGLAYINYQKQFDRLFYGVGIRIFSGWNEATQTPIVQTIDPLSWLPDPYATFTCEDARFHGFELEVTKRDLMQEKDFFNLKHLSSTIQTETRTSNQERSAVQGIDGNMDTLDLNPDYDGAVYNIVVLYTILKDTKGNLKKYEVTLANNESLIIRLRPVEAMTSVEKAHPELIKFPVILNYYSPNRKDPYGTSIPDLVEDKQRFRSVLANLKIKREKAALYPMYIYDALKVLNSQDLNFDFNKFIRIRGDVTGAVAPLNKDLNSTTTTMIEREIDMEANKSTGADLIQQGVLGGGERTAREVQAAQANANLRFALHSTIDQLGDIKFWDYWRKMYVKYFDEKSTKTVVFDTGIGSSSLPLSRKDLITNSDPVIRVVSKLKARDDRKEERLAFSQIFPLINSDPSTPKITKDFSLRYLLKLNEISDDKIDILAPKSADELIALQENELLSRGHNVKINDTDDDLSHLMYHSQADKTIETTIHCMAHKLRMSMIKPKTSETNPAMINAANVAQSQIGGQMGQQRTSTLSPSVSNFAVSK